MATAIVHGFYWSLLLGATGAIIWGFLAAFGVIPNDQSSRSPVYALGGFWAFSFVMVSVWGWMVRDR